MRKITTTLLAASLLVLGAALPASAHLAGPCDDSDGDGMASGREYAAHHISAFAQEGLLGNEGHKPGTHRGFSACDPSGR
jgi:hypothetical protein